MTGFGGSRPGTQDPRPTRGGRGVGQVGPPPGGIFPLPRRSSNPAKEAASD